MVRLNLPRRARSGALSARGCLVVPLIIVVGWALLWLLNRQLAPVVVALAQERGRGLATQALNLAVQKQVAAGLELGSLIDEQRGPDGRFLYYRVNTQLLNQVAAQAAEAVQAELEFMREHPIEIALGRLSGLEILAGFGPKFKARVMPEGQVLLDVEQEFNAAGINQTIHIINLVAHASLRVTVPLMNQRIEFTVRAPLVTNVIQGPVPNYLWPAALPGG